MLLTVPPLAVYSVDGCGSHLLINFILLLALAWPAVLHALYLIYLDNERKERMDDEIVQMEGSAGSWESYDARDSQDRSRSSGRGVHFE